ncbi:MAG: hypothetical protein K1X89_07005 [Myxococcaceae bacterium]|nr:hypothetical protein [Myxococcaceae bacterium]
MPTAMEPQSDPAWVPCLEGQVSQARELERVLAEQGIEARLQKPPAKACCGGSCGCGAKVQVAVREADVPKVQAFFRDEWAEALRKEGTLAPDAALVQLGIPTDGEPPCPACGTAAPLVGGACSDCGLQLE